MSTITKKDLALLVSQSTACKKNLAAKMVDSLFVAMRASWIEGNRIEIRRFGAEVRLQDSIPVVALRRDEARVADEPADRRAGRRGG